MGVGIKSCDNTPRACGGREGAGRESEGAGGEREGAGGERQGKGVSEPCMDMHGSAPTLRLLVQFFRPAAVAGPGYLSMAQ